MRQTKDQEKAVFAAEDKYGLEGKEIFNFSLVESEILRRTEKRVGEGKNISPEPINIDIFSQRFPDLQIVDLPGFIKTPVAGQNDDIEEQVLALNKKYMKDEDTVILAVHDSTQDIAVCEALKHALHKDVDPEGKRTLGVLTKLDLLQTAADLRRVEEIITNNTKPLKLGYVGVVNQRREAENVGESDMQRSRLELSSIWRKEDVKRKIGIKHLRQFITITLAKKLTLAMPHWKQHLLNAKQEMENELRQLGCSEDDIAYEDLIAKFVEEVVEKMKVNIIGMDVNIETNKKGAGATINEKIHEGIKTASKEARRAYSVFEFIKILKTSIKNMHGIRDHILPTEIVLDIAISLLTESYRNQFLDLLTNTEHILVDNLRSLLTTSLKHYPQFKDLVTNILTKEISKNKDSAENYINVMIEMHKRTLNSHHPDLKKIKLNQDATTWFKEGISRKEKYAQYQTESKDFYGNIDGMELSVQSDNWVTENVPTAFQTPGTIHISETQDLPQPHDRKSDNVFNIIGFSERVQSRDNYIPTRQYPTELEDEAKFHLDIALEYMEIIDKQLVDETLKIIILMLVHKTMDFFRGGIHYRYESLIHILFFLLFLS